MVVFRDTSTSATNGLVATVPLRRPSARRTIVGPECDRVYVVGDTLSCLYTEPGVATTFHGEVRDREGHVVSSWPVAGLPSRTRVSPSGRLVSETSFVTGHEYEQEAFSTSTEILRRNGAGYGNLERFTLLHNGKQVTARDRNIWGVTFADDNRFYATAAWSGTAWLVRGDLAARTLTALRRNAECPSLSPDGHRIAYKKRVPASSDHWSLAVLDLRTGHETVLGETRSVDDQAEWSSAHTVLYGLPRAHQPGVSDVWALGTAAGEAPRLLVPNAWSPSVLR